MHFFIKKRNGSTLKVYNHEIITFVKRKPTLTLIKGIKREMTEDAFIRRSLRTRVCVFVPVWSSESADKGR